MPSAVAPSRELEAALRGLLARRVGAARDLDADGWAALFHLARRHGVTEALNGALRTAGVAPPPAIARAQTRQAAAWAIERDAAWGALTAVTTALADAGIDAVVLKGFPLAARLYDAPALRPSTDHDLLVCPADLDAAAHVLTSLGYAAEAAARARFFRARHYHLHFRKGELPTIELHFLATRAFGAAIAADAIVDRARPFIHDGATVRVPAPEDEIVYLAVHAAAHRFERLGWLFDIHRLVERTPDLDWRVVAERAGALRLTPALAIALTLAAQTFGTADAWSRHVDPPAGWRRRAATLFAPTRAPHSADAIARFAYGVTLCAGPRVALRFAREYAVTKIAHELPLRLRTATGA